MKHRACLGFALRRKLRAVTLEVGCSDPLARLPYDRQPRSCFSSLEVALYNQYLAGFDSSQCKVVPLVVGYADRNPTFDRGPMSITGKSGDVGQKKFVVPGTDFRRQASPSDSETLARFLIFMTFERPT